MARRLGSRRRPAAREVAAGDGLHPPGGEGRGRGHARRDRGDPRRRERPRDRGRVSSRDDPRRQRVSGLRSLHPPDVAPGRGAHDLAGGAFPRRRRGHAGDRRGLSEVPGADGPAGLRRSRAGGGGGIRPARHRRHGGHLRRHHAGSPGPATSTAHGTRWRRRPALPTITATTAAISSPSGFRRAGPEGRRWSGWRPVRGWS